jgi:nucleotide-binding universal stress UspA family protein
LATLVEMVVHVPLEVELDAIATQAGPAEGLLSAAEGASLLVLGTRGCGGAASILLGSVGSEVLKRATCPIVTVPPERVERGQQPLDREVATVSTGASR